MTATATAPTDQRLLSLDVFRGMTVAGMMLVNTPGSWSHVYPPLLHAEWNGCTPTDLVFPFFLFVVGVALHLVVTFYRRAYARPREYIWVSGILLLVLALGSRFTGRLLPWDTIGLEASRLGLDMLSAVPLVGDVTATWLRGGEQFGPNTLSRFFTTHVLVLPWLTVIVTLLHLHLVRRRAVEGGGA